MKKFLISILLFPVLFFVACSSVKTNDVGQNLGVIEVPEGYSIESVVDSSLIDYPMFATFDGNGRLFVFESDGSSPTNEEMTKKPPYHIRLLEDSDGDGKFDKSKIFADSLTFPKGGVFYNGSLYVSSCPDFLRLTDTDGDGVADKREVILTGWVLNSNAALLGGPFFGPDGWMYLTDARRGFDITTKEGKQLKGTGARIWRCRPDGTELESMSGGGFDNSIELVFMPSGETIGTMTYFINPQAGLRDALMHWVEGGVYPKFNNVIEKDKLKLTGELMPVMSKNARVAPSGLLRYRSNVFGDDFQGDLFSAEFNTGKIIRHRISKDGATFKTEDEAFITSTSQDIHFTDVVEDADGSMLVLNTGGWFILGCPLSRVAKLTELGGIYRVRKNKSPKVEDPWGRKIDFNALPIDELVKKVDDSRFAVRDHAIEKLIEQKEKAVPAIISGLLKSNSEETRAAAVFMLYRINTPTSIQAILPALNDASVIVKTAAARVLGLAKHNSAVPKLAELVQKDDPAVRRQAATALGQIGDAAASESLLAAASNNDDRFVEHAIIYSLINLKNEAVLRNHLKNSSVNVQRAAVIALDQMDGSPLKKMDIVPFLSSNNPRLRTTGIWVASHHIEWSDVVVNFLEKNLDSILRSKEAGEEVSKLIITFSGDTRVQNFIAKELASAGSNERKSFLFNIIEHSSVKKIPEVWVQQLAKKLQDKDIAVRKQVLGLIESRNIKELNQHLNNIILDPSYTYDYRLSALKSRLISAPEFSEKEFQLVLKCLDTTNESPVRQTAARVLNSAKLTNEQLVLLANDQLSKADIFLLPSLVNTFRGNKDEQVGDALVKSLQGSSNKLDNLSESDLDTIFSQFPPSVKRSSATVMQSLRDRQAERLAKLEQVQKGLVKGDVGRGRKLFFGKAVCSSCHEVAKEGDNLGPDLTNIGDIRSQHDLLEAILYPSASFAREYETSKISTKTTSHTGIIKEQMPDAITIATAPGQVVRVQRSEITNIETQNVSMMVPGLDKLLTNQELSDLLLYLETLPDGISGKKEK